MLRWVGLLWVMLGCVGSCWVALGHGFVLGCVGSCWDVLGCVGLRWVMLGCVGSCWDALGHTAARLDPEVEVPIHQRCATAEVLGHVIQPTPLQPAHLPVPPAQLQGHPEGVEPHRLHRQRPLLVKQGEQLHPYRINSTALT